MDPIFLGLFFPAVYQMPKVVQLTNTQGEIVGKGYVFNGRMVMRNAKGELIGTLVYEHGKPVFYDLHGQTIRRPPVLNVSE